MREMDRDFQDVLDLIPTLPKRLKEIREVLLANLVMIAEIPAPTFHEEHRVEFLRNRFTGDDLLNSSTDEKGNAVGILPGEKGEQNILIVAHLDTETPDNADHTITVRQDRVIGPAVGDNSLGVATVASLPFILKHLDISLQSNLILLGASRSFGRGNLEGLRFFLTNKEIPICAGVCIEGIQLGRLSYSSIGMLRGEISCSVPESYDWSRFGAVGAIVTINDVINRILKIPTPRRPRTTIVLGSVQGGTASFTSIPKRAVLRFEVRSESAKMVNRIMERIEDIVTEVGYQSGAEVTFNILARREPGGIQFTHPLARNTWRIMKTLNINPRTSPSTSELSAFIDQSIPAITVGLTFGDKLDDENEEVRIDPMFVGLAQLLGLLIAVDKGYCFEY